MMLRRLHRHDAAMHRVNLEEFLGQGSFHEDRAGRTQPLDGLARRRLHLLIRVLLEKASQESQPRMRLPPGRRTFFFT